MGVIHKFNGKDGDFSWDGVPVDTYPGDRGKQVTRQVMIGPGDGAKNFAVRYFEVDPGGHTSLDNHEHDHGVIVVRGRGKVLLGDKKYDIDYGDAIYISPNETHRFENDSDRPLGFSCVIPPKKEIGSDV